MRQHFYPAGDLPLEPPSVVKVQRQNSTSVRICQEMIKSRVIKFNTIIRSDANFITYVGASRLSGGPVNTSADGMVRCYGCYDEFYQNAGGVNACP